MREIAPMLSIHPEAKLSELQPAYSKPYVDSYENRVRVWITGNRIFYARAESSASTSESDKQFGSSSAFR